MVRPKPGGGPKEVANYIYVNVTVFKHCMYFILRVSNSPEL